MTRTITQTITQTIHRDHRPNSVGGTTATNGATLRRTAQTPSQERCARLVPTEVWLPARVEDIAEGVVRLLSASHGPVPVALTRADLLRHLRPARSRGESRRQQERVRKQV